MGTLVRVLLGMLGVILFGLLLGFSAQSAGKVYSRSRTAKTI